MHKAYYVYVHVEQLTSWMYVYLTESIFAISPSISLLLSL